MVIEQELGQRAARHQIEGEIEIARPPQVVFDVVADERNEPRYNPRLGSVEKLTAGPVGRGTRFRVRTAGRRGGIEMIVELTEFDRPHRLASRTRIGSVDIVYALTFEAVPGGTRMRWAGDLHPGGPLALLRPVLALLGRRQEQAIWSSLKQYLQSGAPPPSALRPGPLDSAGGPGRGRPWRTRRSASRQPRPQEVASGVYRLETGRGLTESNVYFVRSGPSWVLVDAAWPGRGPAIQEAGDLLFGAGTRPAGFLLTHFHPDHSGSALELARRWHLPVHVHPVELPFAGGGYDPAYAHPLDRWVVAPLLRLVPRQRLLQQQARASLKGTAVAFDPAEPMPGLSDWECVPTPGHTPGHAAFFRRSDGVLISGDAVMAVNVNSLTDLLRHRHGVFGPPWITTWNWPLAQRSIETLARLRPRIVASGHGPPLTGEPHLQFPPSRPAFPRHPDSGAHGR
jgi:glyoxylase-like metal-dependent hydrolase (beta-lactamase superfamily II)